MTDGADTGGGDGVDSDVTIAERTARRLGGPRWRELYGAAWEGIRRRDDSRRRRGLPALTRRQRWLAARGGVIDYLRSDGGEWTGRTRGGRVVGLSAVLGGSDLTGPSYGPLEPAAPEPAPDPDARVRELWREVRYARAVRTGRALGGRPARYLYLYAVGGLTFEAIARQSGLCRSAVSQALRRLAPPAAFTAVSGLRRRPADERGAGNG